MQNHPRRKSHASSFFSMQWLYVLLVSMVMVAVTTARIAAQDFTLEPARNSIVNVDASSKIMMNGQAIASAIGSGGRISVVGTQHHDLWFLASGSVFDAVGARLAIAKDGKVIVYDNLTSTPVATLGQNHQQCFLTADGKRVFATGNNEIAVYDVERKKLIYGVATGNAFGNLYVPDKVGDKLYVARPGGVLELWDVKNNNKLGSVSLFSANFCDAKLSRDAQYLFVLSSNGWIMKIPVGTLNVENSIKTSYGAANSIAFSTTGDTFVVAHALGKVTTWRTADFSLSSTITSDGKNVIVAYINSDHDLLIIKQSPTGVATTSYVMSLARPNIATKFSNITDSVLGEETSALEFECGGNRLTASLPPYTNASPQQLKVEDVFVSNWAYSVLGDTSYRQCLLATQPGNQQYLIGCSDGKVRVFQNTNSEPLAVLDAGVGYCYSLAYDVPGHRFATLYQNSMLRIWDAQTLQKISEFYVVNEPYSTTIAFGSGADTLYHFTQSGLVRYDLNLQAAVWTRGAGKGGALSGDLTRAIAGADNPAIIDTESGAIIRNLPASGTCCALTPNEYFLGSNEPTFGRFEDGATLGHILLKLSSRIGASTGNAGIFKVSPGYECLLGVGLVNIKFAFRNPLSSKGITLRVLANISGDFGPMNRHAASFEFIDPSTGDVVAQANNVTGTWGDYSGNANIERRVLDVRVKLSGGLSRLVRDVDFSTGTKIVEVECLNGDINNDNYVGTDDYLILNDAYDSMEGDPNWVDAADLNGDGIVNSDDYELLNASFDTVGE